MRGQTSVAVAVRQPSGQILVHCEPLQGAMLKWAKYPLLRGTVVLWETLVLGVRALLFSAEAALTDEEVKPTSGVAWFTLGVALVLAVGFFFVVPVLITALVDPYIHSSPLVSNLVEKVIRLGLLVGYMFGIGHIPDIRRVFAYHGAEHKTINALEAGEPMNVDTVQRYSTAHTRCGTSFLLVVVVVSFVFFLVLGTPPLMERVISRIVLIPVVAAVAYELIRLGATHHEKPWVKALLTPGMALQKLTTREPDASQVEVAIAALDRVMAEDRLAEAPPEAAKTSAAAPAVLPHPLPAPRPEAHS